MATEKCRKRRKELKYFQISLTFLQMFIFVQNVRNIAAQGCLQVNIQENSDIPNLNVFAKYEGQGIALAEKLVEQTNEFVQPIPVDSSAITFVPPFLDFDDNSIGIPSVKTVHILNHHKTKPLQLVSISAHTSHFHSSFFDEKMVPANGNTSFEVVFLARILGNVENTLFINTAVGVFSYHVFGIGTPNVYRLRPYLDAKVAINSSFSSLISIYNPTSLSLQVTEVYSSSGYLHLQLPNGKTEDTKRAWEIPPYGMKPLMKASFLGQVADNHTAFIRIKTNQSDASQYIILPVEVEVSSKPGIFSASELLDFGTLTHQDGTKTLELFLLNSGHKDIQISSIKVFPANPAIQIEFKSIKLKYSEALYTKVANISFHVKLVVSSEQWSGKIVVTTKEKSYKKIEIPYRANILDGTLGYDESSTFFQLPPHVKDFVCAINNISLINSFLFPIILHKLELPSHIKKYYKILDNFLPITLHSQRLTDCFSLQCTNESFKLLNRGSGEEIHSILLHTNVSTFSLPLHVYTGLLKYEIQSGDLEDLNYGIMGVLDKRYLLLTIYNHNPIDIMILSTNTSIDDLSLSLISITSNNGESHELQCNADQETDVLLPKNSYMVLKTYLTAPQLETTLNGSLDIETKYEVLEIPVKAKIAVGSFTVKPEKLKLPPSFPGIIVHQTISVESSFAQISKIENISSPDKRFYYRKLKNVGNELKPGKELKIGKVYFDSRQSCKPDRCFVGLPTSTTTGHHWLTTLNLGKEAPEQDSKLYKLLRERWNSIRDDNSTNIVTSFNLQTNLLQNFDIPVAATLYWPSLLEEPKFRFPLTLVGKTSVSEITLFNPSDFPIILQILPISFYPQPLVVLDALQQTELIHRSEFVLDNLDIFQIKMPNNFSTQDTSSQMMWLEYTLNGKTNRSCINMFLNPGQKQKIEVSFSPTAESLASTVILIRNNLTVLDYLLVEGAGVTERLKVGGRLSDDLSESLRFKLTETLLRDCNSGEEKTDLPSITVRKSFTAKNLGLLPLQVLYLMIDNYPCEGYGFRILECNPFLLQPNATNQIAIAYTPDFTSSKVFRTLRIVSSQGSVLSFNLNATLPHHMLRICQKAIPRPSWEKNLYYFVTIMIISLFIGVLLAAYLEAMNIWEPFLRLFKFADSEVQPDSLKTFDLQQIATNYISNVKAPNQPTNSFKELNGQGSIKPEITPTPPTNALSRVKHILDNVRRFNYFDYLRNVTYFYATPRTSEKSSVEELDKLLSSPPVVTEEFLRATRVAAVATTAPRLSRKQTRKQKKLEYEKSRNLKWRGRQPSSSGEVKTEAAEKVSTPPPSTRSTPPSSVRSDLSLSRNNSDVSSNESRSRECSSSSSRGERDVFKAVLPAAVTEVTKKKKRTKSFPPESYHDDSSSTTTEKSNEDLDVIERTAPYQRSPWKGNSITRKHQTQFKECKPKVDTRFQSTYDNSHPGIRSRTNFQKKSQYVWTAASSSNDQPLKILSSRSSSASYDTSSNEDPVWEIPSTKISRKDNDENMRSIVEETKKAELLRREMASNKAKKSSSVKTTTIANRTKKSFNKSPQPPTSKSSPSRPRGQLLKTKSMPDSFPANPAHPTNISPVNINNRRFSNNGSPTANFSMFTSTDNSPNSQTLTPPTNLMTSTLPEWNNFGKNSFNITEDVMSSYATHSQTSFQPVLSSSLHYPTSLQWSNRAYPPNQSIAQWNTGNNLLGINTTRQSPTTQSDGLYDMWGNGGAQSTHSIWSVRNSVTMDEDRSTTEDDPLGLKSIWNSDGRLKRNSFNNDRNFKH